MHVHKMFLNRDTPGALAGGRAEQRRPTAAHGTHITLLLINHVLIFNKNGGMLKYR